MVRGKRYLKGIYWISRSPDIAVVNIYSNCGQDVDRIKNLVHEQEKGEIQSTTATWTATGVLKTIEEKLYQNLVEKLLSISIPTILIPNIECFAIVKLTGGDPHVMLRSISDH